MKAFPALLAIVVSVLPLPALAHEGHSHAPGAVESRHGGDVKSGERVVVELVQQGPELLLYPMTRELAPIPLDDVALEATAKLPRAKERSAVAFTAKGGSDPQGSHFSGAFDAKDSHRFTLELKVTYQGKKETLSFQVEPRR